MKTTVAAVLLFGGATLGAVSIYAPMNASAEPFNLELFRILLQVAADAAMIGGTALGLSRS